ncbi:AAA family ATPase [Streptomyces sp. SID12488]|uniref:AAA family ATPase n=1 Tax=Streptomyces sp. SID12488 TaxID=2706040 RepID=UPI0013DD466D|nr:AAA family ATPase [Streptomyces sp. SID12488]
MRITKVKITNYRGLESVEIPLSRFGCVIGENNAGKSSVFQALNTFLRGSAMDASEFLSKTQSVRVQVSFSDIDADDLARLDSQHRAKIEKEVEDGSLTLLRVYSSPGKGEIRVLSKVPRDSRFSQTALDETLKVGLSAEEVSANVAHTYPEIHAKLNGKITKAAVRREFEEIVSSLPPEEMTEGEGSKLPTGIDRSISALLPDVIYIPAVKELNDEVKTTDSSTFGKLLGLLFGQIEHQMPNLQKSFDDLHRHLNVVIDDQGNEDDQRLKEVRDIEKLIERNLQEAFPRADVRLDIPPPALRTLLSSAEISINDGVPGHFRTKGDGLRRSVTFAILRAYVDQKKKQIKGHSSATERPTVLLFEEPEVFLYPRAQRKLFDALKFFSQYNDVLVTTHSSAFYGPRETGTFVKMIKNHQVDPPVSRAHVIDLSDIDARDQFEIIKHENNEAAFFADSVFLVEGPSDCHLVPHVAKTLNPEWDFQKHAVAIAKVEGKGSIARYRGFFEKFEMQVSVLADLDAVLEGFDKLGASDRCAEIRGRLLPLVDRDAKLVEENQIRGEVLKKMRKSGEVQGLWQQATDLHSAFAKKECTWEELNSAVSAFFDRASSRTKRAVLRDAISADLRKAKLELLSALRAENIFVWERGAIEDYYPPSVYLSSGNKNVRAQRFCESYNTADSLRGLPAFADSDSCEFDLIFSKFFDDVTEK